MKRSRVSSTSGQREGIPESFFEGSFLEEEKQENIDDDPSNVNNDDDDDSSSSSYEEYVNSFLEKEDSWSFDITATGSSMNDDSDEELREKKIKEALEHVCDDLGDVLNEDDDDFSHSSDEKSINSSHQNIITMTNSHHNILKYSCSHDEYCLPEKNCHHKSSCYCHRSPVHIHKNSNTDHHTHERERKQDLEIRNSSADNDLYNVLTPLTTVRLMPQRCTKKNSIVSILNDGQVCVELLKLKREENYVVNVCFISCDGIKISLFKPKEKMLPSEKPPSLPNDTEEVQCYSFENLPKIHWKKYQHAKLFVDIIRAQTPKVTIYGKEAKCVMMENADFEANFYDGYQITEIGEKLTVMDQNGIHLTDENKLDVHVEFLLNTFKNLKEECCELEAYLENRSKGCDSLIDSYFPAFFGRLSKDGLLLIMKTTFRCGFL